MREIIEPNLQPTGFGSPKVRRQCTVAAVHWPPPPNPPCDIPSGCCSFTGPWTVTRSSLRMLRRVAAFCRPLRPVLPLVSFPRSWGAVVGNPLLAGALRAGCQKRPLPSHTPVPSGGSLGLPTECLAQPLYTTKP